MADVHIILPTLPAKQTTTSLALPDDLPFDEWQQIGQQLDRAESAMQWWLGDWWIFAMSGSRYGNRPYQCESWSGLNWRTLANYASVCRAFSEVSRRRDNLPFAHHTEVAPLPVADADRWLDWCEDYAKTEGRAPTRALLRDKLSTRRISVEVEVTTYPTPPVPPVRITDISYSTVIRPVQPPPRPPPIALDTSRGGGPVPAELSGLRIEPSPSFDRLKAAMAIVDDMSIDERHALADYLAALMQA